MSLEAWNTSYDTMRTYELPRYHHPNRFYRGIKAFLFIFPSNLVVFVVHEAFEFVSESIFFGRSFGGVDFLHSGRIANHAVKIRGAFRGHIPEFKDTTSMKLISCIKMNRQRASL